MKRDTVYKIQTSNFFLLLGLMLVWTLAGCTAINPKPEMLKLPVEPPAERVTSFNTALTHMGILSDIHGAKMLKIQTRDIDDVTGTAYHSEGEIPQSITIMVKSALNAIGGRVVYIPFMPEYFAGIQVSGYPVSRQKLVPDVILAGGITEFDRGLATVDRTRNLDAETNDILGEGTAMPGRKIGLDYEKGDKWSKAKIAVDFNLISYQALCGIPKMQASNGITVYKGITEEEFGFTLFGPTIGLRGSIKKVQGRHDAVRLLVQFSIIQLVGRFLDLPYWQLLDGAQPDPVVIEAVKANYLEKNRLLKSLGLQRLLWLHGHKVAINGQMDAETKAALAKVEPAYDGRADTVSADLYLKLYLSVPVTKENVALASQFDRRWAQLQAARQKKTPAPEKKPEKQKQSKKPADTQSKTESKQEQQASKPEATKPAATEKDNKPIITPIDMETQETLDRIIQRLEEKRKTRLNVVCNQYIGMVS